MILMVDDEQWRNDSYLAELRLWGYQVHYERDVDEAWRWFEEHQGEIEAVILDIMMSPGKRYIADERTRGGLITGVLLYRDMRKVLPVLPVIFLTNVRFDLVADELQTERNVLILRKLDYLPHTVPEQLDLLLTRNRAGSNVAETDT